jgi:hypothetical protein
MLPFLYDPCDPNRFRTAHSSGAHLKPGAQKPGFFVFQAESEPGVQGLKSAKVLTNTLPAFTIGERIVPLNSRVHCRFRGKCQ